MDTVDGSIIFRNYHMPQDNMAPNQTDNDMEIISAMSIGGHMGVNGSLGYMNLNRVPCHICNKTYISKRSKYLHIRYVHQNIRKHACQFCEKRFHKKCDVDRHHAIHYRNNHTPRSGFKIENDNSFEMKVHTDINTAQSQAAYKNNVQSNINEVSQYSEMENSNSLGMNVRTDFETAQKIQAAFVSSVQSSMNEMTEYSINSSHYKLKSQNENIFTSERAKKTHSINTDGLSLAAQRLLLYVLTKNLTCCPVCNKLYSSKYSLKEHIRYVHNNVRNHACEICGKRFYKKSDVGRHVLVHEKKPLGSPTGRGRPSTDNNFTNWDTGNFEVIQEEGEVIMQEEGEVMMQEEGEVMMQEEGEVMMQEEGEVMMQEEGEIIQEESKVDSAVETKNGAVLLCDAVETKKGAVLLCDVQIDNNADQKNRFVKDISTVKIPQAIDESKMISPQTLEEIYYEKNHEIIILDNAEEPQVLKITSLNNTPELNRFEDQNQKIKDIWSPLRLCQQNDRDPNHNVNKKSSVIRICGQPAQNFNKCQKCGALFTYKGLLETHSCSLTCKDTYEGSIILECEEGPVFDRSDYEEGLVFDQQIIIEYE